jgi:hypothetical protein
MRAIKIGAGMKLTYEASSCLFCFYTHLYTFVDVLYLNYNKLCMWNSNMENL